MIKQFFEFIISRFIRKDHLFDLRRSKEDWGFVDECDVIEIVLIKSFISFKNRLNQCGHDAGFNQSELDIFDNIESRIKQFKSLEAEDNYEEFVDETLLLIFNNRKLFWVD